MTGRERGIFLSITCLGMSSLITQIITLREFMNILAGNELVIGIVLSNWLLLTGMGAYLGRISRRLRNPLLWLISGQVAIAILPLIHISLIRLLNTFFLAGAIPGLDRTIMLSFALLSPYCLVSGFMLTLFSRLGGRERNAGQIGKVYVFDVTGDIIGGFLFSFLLVYLFSTYQSLLLLLVINLSAAALLSLMYYGKKIFAAVAAILLFCLTTTMLFNLEKITAGMMFPGQKIVSHSSTPYGSLVVARAENQVVVYSNGIVAGSSQDLTAAEESIHYGLSQHPDPKHILLVSGGLNGNIKEAVKYPVDTIDYVELDPQIINLVKQYALPEDDNRIRMIAEDARRFIQAKTAFYDAVLIDLPDPSTAQLNRYYTIEFFHAVQKALTTDGIFSFRLSGAENYAQADIGLLAATVYQSLASVFPNILVIPGANQHFIVSTGDLRYSIGDLLAEKNIQTVYVTKEYLKAKLTRDRIESANTMVQSPASINRDFHPVGYFLLMHYWLSQFQDNLLLPLIIMGTVSLVIVYLVMDNPSRSSQVAVCTSGFAGLGLEIILIIAFQVCYGYVYQQLGLIITGFLLGTALGSAWSLRFRRNPLPLLAKVDLVLAITAFGLGLLLPGFRSALFSSLPTFVPPLLFAGLTSLVGFLVGAQFPLAARLGFKEVEQTAGSLYALDYFGAALGGLVIATLAIPVLGITATCTLLGCIKLTSTGLLRLQKTTTLSALAAATPAHTSRTFAALAALIFFIAQGVLICVDATSMTLYALSFQPMYHLLLLLLTVYGILQAMGGKNHLNSRLHHSAARLQRWSNFLFFSLVVFFPVFRCYFKIPYLFCHVCPRHCIFGYLRPYLIPAALIMNLEKRHWCMRCCPLGTLFDCQARLTKKNRSLARVPARALGFVMLAFTTYSYFRIKTDFVQAGTASADWYTFFFKNQFSPLYTVLVVSAAILLLSFFFRRPFCDSICPVGTLSSFLLRTEKRFSSPTVIQHETRGLS